LLEVQNVSKRFGGVRALDGIDFTVGRGEVVTRSKLVAMDGTATRLYRRLHACDLDAVPREWDTREELIGGVLHVALSDLFV